MRGGARWWWKRSTHRPGASCRVSSRAAHCERRARAATRAPLFRAPPDRTLRKDPDRLTEGRSSASLAAVAAKASEEARPRDPKLAASAVGPPAFTADRVEGPRQQ